MIPRRRTLQATLLLVIAMAIPLAMRAGTLVRFHTVFGDLLVELLDEEKPETVRNFLRYVESGRWSGLFTQRVVPGFVVQAGRYTVTNEPAGTPTFLRIGDFGTITNEFGVGPLRSNVYGTLAMAKRDGEPDSASAEWFINLADNSANLDHSNGGFTVFGHVVAGTPVLEIFNGFTWQRPLSIQSTNRLYYLGEPGPFNPFPLPPAFPVLNPLASLEHVYTNVVHFDIRTESLHADPPAGGGAGISWTGISGFTNRVEVSPSPGGPWTELTNRVPAESVPSSVTDSGDASGPRFYRVRVGD